MPTQATPDKPKPKEWITILDHEQHFTWTKWPHLFNRLFLKYNVPDSFLTFLMFLWSATVGSIDHWSGAIAMSQFPIRNPYARKYIAALVKAGIFTQEKAGAHDRKGSEYEYNDTSRQEWEDFFAMLAIVVDFGGLDDKITPDQFAALVAKGKAAEPVQLRDGTDGSKLLPLDPAVSAKVREIEARLKELASRKPKAGGNRGRYHQKRTR